MSRTALLGGALAGCLCGAALGQTINVDFGSRAGSPSPEYGGAGLPGVWNVIDDVSGPAALVDVAGLPTAVVVSARPAPGIYVADEPATCGEDEALLDDFVPGLGDVVLALFFDGLLNGTYEVITYAWVPAAPEMGSTIFIDTEAGSTDFQLTGGPWPGQLVQGITHTVHEVQVTSGSFTVNMVGSFWWTSGALNGIQLRHQSYLPADANLDGAVNVADLVMVLLNWTTPGHGCDGIESCPGDVNNDDVVDVMDLVIVLTAWTP